MRSRQPPPAKNALALAGGRQASRIGRALATLQQDVDDLRQVVQPAAGRAA